MVPGLVMSMATPATAKGQAAASTSAASQAPVAKQFDLSVVGAPFKGNADQRLFLATIKNSGSQSGKNVIHVIMFPHYNKQSRYDGTYSSQFAKFASAIEPNGIKAKFKDGVLTVTLAKDEKVAARNCKIAIEKA